MKSERNHALDIIRIVSAIGIVMLHYQQSLVGGGMRFGGVTVDAENGPFQFRFFVQVFFVLSGYLSLRYAERIREGLSFPEFFKKRVIRIVPLLAVTVLVYVIFQFLYISMGGYLETDPYVPNLWGTITAMLGVARLWCFEGAGIMEPTWFLCGLLLCYAIMYFLVFYAGRKKISELYLFGLMVMIGCSLLIVGTEIPFLTISGGRAYSAFFFGLLFAAYRKRREPKALHYLCAAVILLIVTGSALIAPDFIAFGQIHIVTFLVSPACILLAESPAAKKIFAWKGFGEAGAWTYSVFLWHKPLILILLCLLTANGLSMDFSQPVVFFAFLLLLFVISAVSYHLIELPVTRLAEKRHDRGSSNADAL